MGGLIFTCPASPAWWYISPKFLPTFISAGFPLNMKASVSEWDFSTERAQIWVKSVASHACSSINLTWQFDLRERETCGLQNFKCKWIASEFGSCLFIKQCSTLLRTLGDSGQISVGLPFYHFLQSIVVMIIFLALSSFFHYHWLWRW